MRPATIRDNIIARISLVMLCLVVLGWAQGAVAATDIPPKVKLTAPANHAVFAAPANITLTATASDKDGTIKRVEFFNGTKRLATVKSAPYTFGWTHVKAGKYTLTAVATDNKNVKTTSHAVHIIVDILPKVSLTSPANNAIFNAPASVTLTAKATDPDGKVAKVDFYQGTSLIATLTSKPYTFTLNNVQGGNYSFTAVATDNRGEATTSSPVTITVTAVPNIPPTVSLTTNGATFKAPASVTLTASANDVDGTVAKVDFFQGNTPIASITPPTPFSFTVNNLAQGSYTFTAIATDDKGATTTSNQATITVTPAQAQLFYIYTDQLNTPRVITDQTNKIVWRWDNQDPFGANVPDEDPDGDGQKFTCNLRFPGQYFDKETNTHYNYYRNNDPSIGRYIESDPIGLAGGINTYAYVSSQPTRRVDPLGVAYFAMRPLSQFITIGLMTHNPLLAFLDLNVAHEQVFFEDGLSPSNVGFFDDGTVHPDLIPIGYLPVDGGYDDCIMRKAVTQTPPPAPYNLFCRNCQTWGRLVRQTYARLAADPQIQQECGCKPNFQTSPSSRSATRDDLFDQLQGTGTSRRQSGIGVPGIFPTPVFPIP